MIKTHFKHSEMNGESNIMIINETQIKKDTHIHVNIKFYKIELVHLHLQYLKMLEKNKIADLSK